LKYIFSCLFVLFFTITPLSAFCQAERGGVPRSFQLQFAIKAQQRLVEIAPPDMEAVQNEDIDDSRLEKPYRVGVEVPVAISLPDAGQWDYLPGGGRISRLTISCKGAQGIGIEYDKLFLPEGCDLFLYTPDHHKVIGALTSTEVPLNSKFTTRPVYGDQIVLEYFEPLNAKETAQIEISGISYIYRGFESNVINSGKSIQSGSCEVNINCTEGQNWQNQKQGVVKILTKVGSKFFYCTGTVMNNTSQDFSGLLLTASHCSKDFQGGTSSIDDFSQWIFYFNYESPGCSSAPADEYTVVGAEKLATSDNLSDIGSDFLLLKFQGSIPPSYNTYYCGWDAGNNNSFSGVGIHHPDGDIKKISTYTSLLGSGTWGSSPNTHWIVSWAATPNGHGVTEGGSSGSPIFDDEGLVIGTLTGGESSCDNPAGEDMYGKVSYSWESNGNSDTLQLKPWLDPGNTGTLKMPGSFNEKLAVADFSANAYIIPVGGTVNFQDLSAGKPDKWHWYFQRGNPSESLEQNPAGISFESYGAMNVKLVVSNQYNSDSIVKEGYIDVRALISPNPSTGDINVLADINNPDNVVIDVFDAIGKIAQHFEYTGSVSASYPIKLPDYGNVFFVRLSHGKQIQTSKVIVVR